MQMRVILIYKDGGDVFGMNGRSVDERWNAVRVIWGGRDGLGLPVLWVGVSVVHQTQPQCGAFTQQRG